MYKSPYYCSFSFLVVLMTLLTCLKLTPPTAHVHADPHPHQGKLQPFQPGDPKVKLDSKALQILQNNKPYQTQILSPDGSSGRGLVVQDVAAPTSVVWDRILDYDHYADMVPKTVYSQNYQVIRHTKHHHHHHHPAQTIFTKMTVGFPMLKLSFYVKHEYQPHLKSLTWTLDYSKKSDLDDSCGYWYVIPHPDDPKHKTRVYYSVEVSMFDWVPQFVVNFMCHKALTDATGWVKKYSEMEYEKQQEQEQQRQEDATSTSTSTTLSTKKKKKGLVQWFFATTTDGDDDTTGEEATTCAEASDSDECRDVDHKEHAMSATTTRTTSTMTSKTKESLGLARYGLITYVFALGVYNVHLYLSQ